MTFCCKNYHESARGCGKLGGECVPGRKGCVLDGEFKLSPALAARVDATRDRPVTAGRDPKERP